ncbi:MAG: carbohydrate kinase family protein [Peptostreptococcaceae bacterium]
MSKVFTMGEALIDFAPVESGKGLKDISGFTKLPGGAPANVAACVAKLGGESAFIGMLGADGFGDFLVETLKNENVDTKYIKRTTKAKTGLAFVALSNEGEREFSFYRNPSADMLLSEEDIDKTWFNKGDILHFCSVDLIEAPVKYAHKKAIEYIKERGGIVSFDPNVRQNLWNDLYECKRTINEFIPHANILKISDEELEFITGITDTTQAIKSLFVGNVEVILYTKGKDGVDLYTKDKMINVEGFKVEVLDTTGAGDSFIGAFLYNLAKGNFNVNDIESIEYVCRFSNAVAALTTTKNGGISALPGIEDVNNIIELIVPPF